MSITKLAVFEKIKADGSLTRSRMEVYQALMLWEPASMDKIADILGRKLHTISGRFSELKAQGMIVECGVDKNQYGNAVTLWTTTDRDTPLPLPKKESRLDLLRKENEELRAEVARLTAELAEKHSIVSHSQGVLFDTERRTQ